MASTYSTNLAIELIGTGDQAGTWGVTTNSNLGTLIEQAISGYVTQAVATGTDTTITIPNGATGVARNMYIELTGTGGTNTNLIVPSNKKLYFIFNNSTGAVTVKVTGQTGVSVPQGKKMILVSNGTDIVNGVNYIADFGTNSFTVTNLTASSATITNLIATTASISDASATVLRASSATLTHLSATSASITNLALTSLTISSLNITNVSVASATVSSNLVLSSGTANGVLYLNGSKVATSGSALTFDGTNLALTGSNPIYRVPAAGGYLFTADGNTGIFLQQTGTPQNSFFVGGSERMRLTTTGLGIGTSSPAAKLDVVGTAQISSDLTLSGGTAGGVLFLSSPGKVATSGSGLTFNGSTFRVSAADSTLIGLINGATRGMRFGANTTGSVIEGVDNTGVAAYYPLTVGGSDLRFTVSSAEAMRLTSTGLGIGTSSPGTQLQVTGTGTTLSGSTTYNLQVNSSSTGYGVRLGQDGTNGTISGIGTSGLTFWTYNGSAWGERLRIDSAGNMGLGVTPSAWGTSTRRAIQVNSGSIDSGSATGSNVAIRSNEYFDGTNNVYINTQAAAAYIQNNGQHAFYTAPSGTAGTNVSYTQAMTLNTSNNLLLGTTASVTSWTSGRAMDLQIAKSGAIYPGISSYAYSTTVSSGGMVTLGRSRGSFGTLSTTSANDGLGYLAFEGVNSSNTLISPAYIAAFQDGAAGATNIPGRISFFTSSGSANPAERLRIDSSGNVGIGTSSPATSLSVDNTRSDTAGTGWFTYTNAAVTSGRRGMRVDTNNGYWFDYYNGSTWSAQMGINSSGNLGLGVTPSAWGTASSSRAIELNAGAIWSLSTSDFNLLNNAYYNGTNYIYKASTGATRYLMDAAGGAHRWYTAPSGTAGNNITFTNTMTLDASGRLLLGTTTVGRTLTVYAASTPGIQISNSSSGTGAANGMEMVLDGTDAVLYNQESGHLRFGTSGTEKARITAAGYFKASPDSTYVGVGNTYHEFCGDAAGRLIFFENYNASTPVGARIDYSAAAPNSTGAEFLYCSDTGGQRASIRSNGGLANYQSNNVDLSDARTKNSITPAASMWDKIGALEIVTYKYNDQTHDDVNVGVIAQQVESVEPVWVDADGFGETPEGEEPLKTVYTKDITFAAIKALQEAMARIEKLEAEVAALKGA